MYTCPVCNEKFEDSEFSNFIDGCKYLILFNRVGICDNYQSLLDKYNKNNENDKWACDNCLKSGRVLKADLEKQFYYFSLPYHTYHDVYTNCIECGDFFIFTKEEQRYWFEELYFYVESKALRCKKCRNEKRKRASDSVYLQKLIEKNDKTEEDYFELIKYFKDKKNTNKENYWIGIYRKIRTKT